MQLRDKQDQFAGMVAELIQEARKKGYQVTLGEAFRPSELAELYAKQGRGISNSLHTARLAIDINLFKDGEYLSRSQDYEPLGLWWESIGGSWGGRFRDGNHFSLSHEGRK